MKIIIIYLNSKKPVSADLEFSKRHIFRACTREISDPSRLVRYFAEVRNFA